MRSTGLPKSVVESELSKALKNAFSLERENLARDLNPVSQLASLISRWHVEKQYVVRSGKPRPLTWNGSRGTLLRLANEVIGAKGAKRVVETAIRQRLVQRTPDGKWKPKSQIVKPRGLDRSQVLRTAVMLKRLLNTVAHNSERRYSGEDVLFEVMTRVPRLPARFLPTFKRFVRAQGMTYVRAVDDWLEARNLPRVRRSRRNLREAGVVVFAFEEAAVDL
jgi:hypothetical protein